MVMTISSFKKSDESLIISESDKKSYYSSFSDESALAIGIISQKVSLVSLDSPTLYSKLAMKGVISIYPARQHHVTLQLMLQSLNYLLLRQFYLSKLPPLL